MKGDYGNAKKRASARRRLVGQLCDCLGVGLGPGFGGNGRHLNLLHVWQAAEHITQIEGRIDFVPVTTAQNRVNHGASPARLGMANEQEVLFSNGRGPNDVFYVEVSIMPRSQRKGLV